MEINNPWSQARFLESEAHFSGLGSLIIGILSNSKSTKPHCYLSDISSHSNKYSLLLVFVTLTIIETLKVSMWGHEKLIQTKKCNRLKKESQQVVAIRLTELTELLVIWCLAERKRCFINVLAARPGLSWAKRVNITGNVLLWSCYHMVILLSSLAQTQLY